MALGATCVQKLDGSRDSAIHTKYRISLRSSSMQEPRYPLPRVVYILSCITRPARAPSPVPTGGSGIILVPWHILCRGLGLVGRGAHKVAAPPNPREVEELNTYSHPNVFKQVHGLISM